MGRASSCCSAGPRSENANSHSAAFSSMRQFAASSIASSTSPNGSPADQLRDRVPVAGQGRPSWVPLIGGPLSRSRRCRDTSAPVPSGARHYHSAPASHKRFSIFRGVHRSMPESAEFRRAWREGVAWRTRCWRDSNASSPSRGAHTRRGSARKVSQCTSSEQGQPPAR